MVAEPVHVRCDALRVQQVIANLLSNALKYSPEASSFLVTASLDHEKVVTTVEDEGPGVPPGDRERIFEKFTRLGDHLTRPQQGVGLGLYIARRSLDEMGGEIWCDERPGGGARFGFSLRAHTAPRASGAKPSPAATALRA